MYDCVSHRKENSTELVSNNKIFLCAETVKAKGYWYVAGNTFAALLIKEKRMKLTAKEIHKQIIDRIT